MSNSLYDIISGVLTGTPATATLLGADPDWLVRVRCTKPSGDQRPDGLRDDVEGDPGFSFAVAEAILEVRGAALNDAQRTAVHKILWHAGTDDFIDYSHFGYFEPTQLDPSDDLAILFSSAAKAAGVAKELTEALS